MKSMRLRRFGRRFSEFLVQCRDEEEGGSMVIGAITMFTLVVFITLILNTGLLSGDKLAMQNSADAAAYSGAIVGANSLNSVASINDGMALIYYSLMRYNIDMITFGVLKELDVHHQLAMFHPKGYYSKALGQAQPWILKSVNPKIESRSIYPEFVDDQGTVIPSSRFPERYKLVRKTAEKMIPNGLKWLETLAETERMIARATPRLMKEVIFNVAKANGAERVAIFPPLDDDFFLGGKNSLLKVSDLRRDIIGVPGGAKFLLAFTERYQTRQVLYPNPTEMPKEWYSPLHGRSKIGEGFYQVRICWNMQDIRHGYKKRPDHSRSPLMGPFVKGGPNGHWHGSHDHLIVDPFTPEVKEESHYGGHGNDLTDIATYLPGVDPRVHILAVDKLTRFDWAHHEVVTCPTCFATDSTSPLDYPDVRVTERFVNEDYGNLDLPPHTVPRSLRELYSPVESRNKIASRQPLVLTENILNHGINVAVHRKSRRNLLGGLFPIPGWGQIGTASARIGLYIDGGNSPVKKIDIKGDRRGGSTWLRDLKNSALGPEKIDENNYLSEETYFSARLAPINLPSYGPAPGGNNSGVAGLRGLLIANNWRTGPNAGPDPEGNNIAQKLQQQINFNVTLQKSINH
jgi:hypothetical protein